MGVAMHGPFATSSLVHGSDNQSCAADTGEIPKLLFSIQLFTAAIISLHKSWAASKSRSCSDPSSRCSVIAWSVAWGAIGFVNECLLDRVGLTLAPETRVVKKVARDSEFTN